MTKSFYFIAIIVFAFWNSQFANAQTIETKESEITEVSEITEQPVISQFEHLIDADTIVYQLRKKYGIQGSIHLTQAVWNILSSFNNQEQAQSIWQKAIENITEQDFVNPTINFQFEYGKILSQYTHGMNIQTWNNMRSDFDISAKNLLEFLNNADDFDVYLQLPKIWQIILSEIIKHEEINWADVFTDTFNLFDESKPKINDKNSEEKVEATKSKYNTLSELLKWSRNEDKLSQLPDLLQSEKLIPENDKDLFKSFLRFSLNQSSNNLIASVLSWQELAFHFYRHKDSFTTPDLKNLQNFVEINSAWFTEKSDELANVNSALSEIISQSIDELKTGFIIPEASEELIFNPQFNSKIRGIYKLVEPGFDRYMNLPFRQKIMQELEVCLNISREHEPNPQQPISENQFTGCLSDFARAALENAQSRELAGSLTKIDTKEAIDRALNLPYWQIINILYANETQNECLDDEQELPNPLEWSLAAESILWFADRWPGLLQAYPKIKQKINAVINQGERLNKKLTCINNNYQELLSRHFEKIQQSWKNSKAEIKLVANEYNQQNLKEESDVDLLNGLQQQSNYKVKDAQIQACQAQTSCGVRVALEPTRALFGLFPNHLLIADQLKLGELKLCYDNVGWENRRAAPTHLDNDNVANYYGHFSFSLKGFYNDELVFEKKLTNDEENLYLFGSSDESVLQQYCPLPIVGTNINTSLKRGTFGLVPNRLTFLTASRADTSKILTSNWQIGKEWRDKFIGSEAIAGVEIISVNHLEELSQDVQQAFQGKSKELEKLIYQTLLGQISQPTETQKKLTQGLSDYSRSIKLFAAMLYFLQTEDYLLSDNIQSLIFGKTQIAKADEILKHYQNEQSINEFLEFMDNNLKINENKWNNFQTLGSNASLQQTLLRLKSIK